MSGSQEAASAVRMYQEEIRKLLLKKNELERQAVDLMSKLRDAKGQVEHYQREVETRMAEVSLVARELGRAEGQLAAFNGPRGYGGAPAHSGAEPQYNPPFPRR